MIKNSALVYAYSDNNNNNSEVLLGAIIHKHDAPLPLLPCH